MQPGARPSLTPRDKQAGASGRNPDCQGIWGRSALCGLLVRGVATKSCAYKYGVGGGSEEPQGVFPRFLGSPRQQLRGLLPPPPAPAAAPRVLKNVLHPSSPGAELHQGQPLQRRHKFFFYPLGDLQMNPGDSQIRFLFPTFFGGGGGKCPRCVSKTCLCRRPRARARAVCGSQSTQLCEHTRTRIFGFIVVTSRWGICACAAYKHILVT